MGMTPEPFDSKFVKRGPDECWLWSRGTNRGYGAHWVGNTTVGAHRFSWEREHGPVPDGLCVLHKCDVRACVNPAHLFLGTKTDNMIDKVNKGRQAHSRGEAAGGVKLSDEDVQEIRNLLQDKSLRQRDIAQAFGVCQMTISLIKRRKTWSHI